MQQYCTKTWMHYGEIPYYTNIYPSVEQVRMCTDHAETIYAVDVKEASESDNTPYWGWLDNDGNISMVYPRFISFEICFPYGVKAEELKGEGRATRVFITEICEIKKR